MEELSSNKILVKPQTIKKTLFKEILQQLTI